MRRLISIIIICLWGSLAWGNPQSQSGVSNGSIIFDSPSARALGMGNAFSAVGDDVNALYSNPGGLGQIKYFEVAASNQQYVEGIRRGDVAIVFPLGENASTFSRQSLGVLSLSFGLLDFGSFKATDDLGNPIKSFSGRDMLFTAGYGIKVYNSLFFGLSGKAYRAQIGDLTASSILGDAGLLYRPVKSKFALSAVVNNVGGDLQFEKKTDDFPSSIVFGGAFYPVRERVVLSLDLVDPSDGLLEARTGAEWWVNHVFALRGGMDSGFEQGGGLSLGFGVRFESIEFFFIPVQRVQVDYAFRPSEELAENDSRTSVGSHRISLSLRFGEDRRVTKLPR